MTARLLACLLVVACAWRVAATEPNAATRRWWSHVQMLASDDMEGREAGSDGHRKAAAYVASQFRLAGLVAATDEGYLQPVPMRGVRFNAQRSSAELIRPNGDVRPLRWQRQIGNIPREGVPADIDAPLGFTGWEPPTEADARGRFLVALTPPRFVPGPRGYAQAPPAGYAGTIVIDPGTGPEPVRWPFFSSTVMALRERPLTPAAPGAPMGLQFNPADAEELFHGSGHTYAELRTMADRGERLPTFPLAVRLRAHLDIQPLEITSENVVAVLKGTDPVFANEYVVVSAHLDGYGVGEAVNGDRIYNGALDDAAYVATLIDFAQQLRDSRRRFRRSIVFCVFTAEERGMLGSQYFLEHPLVPREQLVANINLDTLRPIFPLTSLTTLGLEDSTLGDTARQVGESMGIRMTVDREPDRMLLRRSDQWTFIQAQIPAVAFVFGYEPGSQEEAIYRRWYAERYHSPSDDVRQPWDPEAAARFNAFFARLVQAVADAPSRPVWRPGASVPPQK
jgi:Zn-dependent M28 family amino/carboxypeptidase